MSILDYLATSLEKPGRAVRGLLGGTPNELLAALPFSDSLGLTDEADKVSGHELLSRLGFDPGDGLGGTLAGIGADVATDPLTYAGGALAKRLLGGGFRPVRKGMAEGDVFDLVQPWERNVGAPLPKVAPGPMPGEVVPAGPLTERLHPGADAPMPAGELLRELPPPSAYHNTIPIEDVRGTPFQPIYDPPKYGYVGDALQDGRPGQAFDNLIGGWDRVLNDFDRLGPEAYTQLTGRPHPALTPVMDEAAQARALADAPLAGQYDGGRPHPAWMGILERHAGDLRAAGLLDGAMHPDLVARARQQLERVKPYLVDETNAGSPALHAVGDLAAGVHRPREAVEMMQQYAPHLPVDERHIRRLAAEGQADALDRTLEQRIYAALEANGADDMMMRAVPDYAQQQGLSQHVYNDLRAAIDPALLAQEGFEPNIIREMLSRRGGRGRLFDPAALEANIAPVHEVLQRLEMPAINEILHGGDFAAMSPQGQQTLLEALRSGRLSRDTWLRAGG